MTINSLLLRPKSRGRVRLRSADPDAMPNIVSGNTKAAVMAAASRAVQRILASGAPA